MKKCSCGGTPVICLSRNLDHHMLITKISCLSCGTTIKPSNAEQTSNSKSIKKIWNDNSSSNEECVPVVVYLNSNGCISHEDSNMLPCPCGETKPIWLRKYLDSEDKVLLNPTDDLMLIEKCAVTLGCGKCDRIIPVMTHKMDIHEQRETEEKLIEAWNNSYPDAMFTLPD